MKPTFTLIFISFLFYSCTSVYFLDPQPKGGLLLNEFPVDLQGNWSDKDGKVIINKKCYEYSPLKSDPAEQRKDTTSNDQLCLSDSVLMYKAENYFVLNIYHQNISKWEVMTFIKKEKNGDITFYYINDPDILTKDKNLKLMNANFNIDGVDTVVTTLHPAHHKQAELNNATFSGQMEVKTIRRIIRNNNNFQTLKGDGSMNRKLINTD